MAHLRLEGVAVNVGGFADDLVADVGVANDGIASLHGLEHGCGRGYGVHGGRLRHKALAVHCGQSGNCSNCGHCGHGGS